MFLPTFRPGDWVIYRKTKHSVHPGPRAANVTPAPHGDGYSYTVDKFWVVREIHSDGAILVQTRRGKLHLVPPGHACLRRANFLQRLIYRSRFEAVEAETLDDTAAGVQVSPSGASDRASA